MTGKLYYSNPYQKEAEASILQILPVGQQFEVVLDQTIFYPEGGGQPSDLGYINGEKVVHVREQDNIIYHLMNTELEKGPATLEIDWDRRFDLMQQHTGEHILSGVFLKLFKGNNKGFHMGDDYITIDIDIKDISPDMIQQAEQVANDYIYKNARVQEIVTDRAGIAQVPLRKPVKVDEDIRVIMLDDIDCCACCGTHVASLGEVGLIKIIKTEAYKGMTRLYVLCGKKAFEDYSNKDAVVRQLKKHLSTEENEIIPRIIKMQEEINELKKLLSAEKIKIAKSIAKELPQGQDHLFLIIDENQEMLQYLEEILAPRYASLILGGEDKKLFVRTTGKEFNVGNFFKEHIKNFQGKGGGRQDRAQGSFETMEAMREFAVKLEKELLGGKQ